MRTHNGSHVAMLLVGVMLVPSMTFGAQAPGTSSRTLAAIAADHAATKQADRQTILNVLNRQEVRKVAEGAGLRIEKTAAAVATLEGVELAQVVEQARQVEDALAGGQLGVSLALTVVLIVLLFLLLLPLAVLGAYGGG